MNLKKRLLAIKCLKIRTNKPLKLFFNMTRLIFSTYFHFYINCTKHASMFFYNLDVNCVADIS